MAGNVFQSFQFEDWSDWNVILPSWTTTLNRDMYCNNLSWSSNAIINPNWYRIYVAWTLSGNFKFQRNWNSGSSVYNEGWGHICPKSWKRQKNKYKREIIKSKNL